MRIIRLSGIRGEMRGFKRYNYAKTYSKIVGVYQIRRLYNHRGWTYQDDRENLSFKTYTGFINPDGKKVIITNPEAFCRENNLQVVHMRELISGIRKSHKGWKWNLNDE